MWTHGILVGLENLSKPPSPSPLSPSYPTNGRPPSHRHNFLFPHSTLNMEEKEGRAVFTPPNYRYATGGGGKFVTHSEPLPSLLLPPPPLLIHGWGEKSVYKVLKKVFPPAL